MDEHCAFCRIVDGEQSARVLYEDDRAVALLDRNPAVRGHTLVVPRVHETELLTGDESPASAVFDAVQTVTRALEATLEPDGFSVFYTSGPLVGTVDHAHVHLLPRFETDGVGLSLTRRELEADEAAALTDRVRNTL